MGVRVYFSRGSRDGALGHFLSAPLQDFRDWYIQESTEEDGGLISVNPALFPLLDSIILQGAEALQPQTMEQAQKIDLLLAAFYFWCNQECQELFGEEIGSGIKSRRYYTATPLIREICGEYSARLWEYIQTGRAIGRPESLFPYKLHEAVAPNAFWTYEEAAFLYYRLLPFKEIFKGTFGKEYQSVIECVFEAVEVAHNEGIGLIIRVA